MTLIIDAKGLILGRVATVAAKNAMLGEEVSIINCETAVITGNRKQLIMKHSHRMELGQPNQGPYFPRKPNLLVRRVVRGMLPWKRARGKAAYHLVRCYNSIPKRFEGCAAISIDSARTDKLPNLKFTSIGELCRLIGAKE